MVTVPKWDRNRPKIWPLPVWRALCQPNLAAHYVHQIALGDYSSSPQEPTNSPGINSLAELFELACGVQFPVCLPTEANRSDTLDDLTRNRICLHRSDSCPGHGRSGPSKKARLVAGADGPVPDLLRADDHAHRGTRRDHRIAARPAARTLPRQRRVICLALQGDAGKDCGGRSSPRSCNQVEDSSDPGSSDPGSNRPDALNSDPDDDPVNPGSNQLHPVFPGGTATTHQKPDREAEAPVPDAD